MGTDTLQLSSFVFSALLATESLLVTTFGSLYSVYVHYVAGIGAAPIIVHLRRLCYLVAAAVLCVVSLNLYIILSFEPGFRELFPDWFLIVLSGVIVIIAVPVLTISRSMVRDASS